MKCVMSFKSYLRHSDSDIDHTPVYTVTLLASHAGTKFCFGQINHYLTQNVRTYITAKSKSLYSLEHMPSTILLWPHPFMQVSMFKYFRCNLNLCTEPYDTVYIVIKLVLQICAYRKSGWEKFPKPQVCTCMYISK